MRALDSLRSHYVTSPQWLQSTGGRVLSMIPPPLLYGGTFRQLRMDIERSRHDAAFVDERVHASLRALIARANSTPYYQDALRTIDVHGPAVADLQRLPILTRADVRKNAERMLSVPASHLDARHTSGTTQASLTVYLDKDRSVREWAFVTNVWGRSGFRLTDRRAYLRRGEEGLASDWTWEPGTRELRLTPYRMVPPVMDLFLDLVARYKINYLHGYPSAITLLAAHARKVGWTPSPRLKGVLPISETLLPHQRSIIRQAFGAVSIQPFYGLSEKVALAGEIGGRPDEYEFEPLYGVAEIVDAGGAPVAIGQRGRLIGTGFISMGMPLIRYDTGDLATLIEAPSADNCWRLRARDISSCYAQEYIITNEGGLASAFASRVHDDRVRDFQIVQQSPGRITLRIVPEEGIGPDQLASIPAAVRADFDDLVAVDMTIVEEIPLTAGGKKRFVEQHLDLADYGGADAVK